MIPVATIHAQNHVILAQKLAILADTSLGEHNERQNQFITSSAQRFCRSFLFLEEIHRLRALKRCIPSEKSGQPKVQIQGNGRPC